MKYRDQSALEKILGILAIPFILLWKLFSFLISLLSKFITAVMKNIYGRVVTIVGGLVLLSLVGYFLHLMQ